MMKVLKRVERVLVFTPAVFCSVAIIAVTDSAVKAQGDGVDTQEKTRLLQASEDLRSGHYEEAIRLFRLETGEEEAFPDADVGLASALSEVGQYEEAVTALRNAIDLHPGSFELHNSLGEVLFYQGKLAEAEEAFGQSITSRAGDYLTAQFNLAELIFQRGERAEALELFDRFIDIYNNNTSLTSEELTAVGRACIYLGRLNPDLFRDALRAFDEAQQADPQNLEPALRTGFLFLDKYNSADASETFDEILRINASHPLALLGRARQQHFDGSRASFATTARALDINPNLLEARTFLGELLLGVEAFSSAAEEAEKALAINPNFLPALYILTAAHYLNSDEEAFKRAGSRVAALNPNDGEFFMKVAQMCVPNRLYIESTGFARQAIEKDPDLWNAYGVLGINQLRTGEIEEGALNLEISFTGDPYNVWIKNTLDLLDTFPSYEISRSDRFEVLIHNKESELLAPIVLELAEEAYDSLADQYGYKPEIPIRIELYPNSPDFSVRTVGLVGLGALGACFGTVIVLDSPSAREAGSFNWGSTLWHELAHAFTLGMTGHRVPRWFTEGLSVFEERRAKPAWGEELSVPFLRAYQQGRILGIATINNGFMRPTYPGQIQVSYFHASVICDWICERYGFESIIRMLDGYNRRLSTTEILQEVLEVSTSEFDRAFDQYVQDRFQAQFSVLKTADNDTMAVAVSAEEIAAMASNNPDDFVAQMTAGSFFYLQEQFERAIPYLERALELLPEYGASDGPDAFLANIYMMQGNTGRAIEMLSNLTAVNETDYSAHMTLARLLKAEDNTQKAAEILNRTLYIYPLEQDLYERLASVHDDLGKYEQAVKARRAVLALDPVDRVEALYLLALAHHRAGERDEARIVVLQALEMAPNYEDALDLLLELHPPPCGENQEEISR